MGRMTALTGRLGDFSNAGRLTGQIIGGAFSVIGRIIGLLWRGVAGLGQVIIGIGKLIGSALLLPLQAALLPLKAIGTAINFFKGDAGKENEKTEAGTAPSAAEVALAATMAAAPLPAAATVQNTDNSTHSYQLTINQQPGEDAQALTERILAELEQRQQQSQREGLHDGL